MEARASNVAAAPEMTQELFDKRHAELAGVIAVARETRQAMVECDARDNLQNLHDRFPLLSLHHEAARRVPDQR